MDIKASEEVKESFEILSKSSVNGGHILLFSTRNMECWSLVQVSRYKTSV